ncbi:hypothetical protein [Methanogenium cariaci]|uniref:hypothetical protein n=1 Tax=Methanogenium cariaci TaxID=2197 RepID=UPI000785A8ED|nr:hypothetical protein [Methanogenium cariaci]
MIITANHSFAAASGMDTDDLSGKNIIEVSGRTDEFKMFLCDRFATVLKSGLPVRFEDRGGMITSMTPFCIR